MSVYFLLNQKKPFLLFSFFKSSAALPCHSLHLVIVFFQKKKKKFLSFCYPPLSFPKCVIKTVFNVSVSLASRDAEMLVKIMKEVTTSNNTFVKIAKNNFVKTIPTADYFYEKKFLKLN
jgi:hypothetical protein